jgi:YD repeat-containing protein
MKTTYTLLLFLVAVFTFSCKKDDTATPPCKLSAIDRGNGYKQDYTYDANGRITRMNRSYAGDNTTSAFNYVYSFSYGTDDLLAKSTWTLDGKADGSETYTYTNGKISKVTFSYVDGTKGINNIKYDASGRISEFSTETGNSDNDFKQVFEYDVNNIMNKRSLSNLKGDVLYSQIVTTAVGVAKSPEQLLATKGIPYDVLMGMPWQISEGGVGSVTDVFGVDDNNKPLKVSTSKVTAIKTNTQGYLTESTFSDGSIQRYTFIDCQ